MLTEPSPFTSPGVGSINFSPTIELNSFQHIAFLNNEIKNNGYDLVPIGGTLIAPLTLYSQNFDSIDAIKEAAGLLK